MSETSVCLFADIKVIEINGKVRTLKKSWIKCDIKELE